MAEQLTKQQAQAVEDRGGKLLVSAAAGSGKTKVLVDRLLLYLTQGQGKINIDDFLIITYTKAAASELRGKIAAKLNERLALDPGNRFLQRQLQRLYLTKISTVHAFCADILREYAYRLDIPGDFRVAEERESRLLQLQVLDRMLEKCYEEDDPEFLTFIDSQELGRDDRSIPQIVLQVYDASRCHVDPDAWLTSCIRQSDVTELTDASQTLWGRYLIEDLHWYLDLQIRAMSRCADLATINGSMPKPAALLAETVLQLQQLRKLDSWDGIVAYPAITYGTLTFPKNCTDLALADRIKAVRNACKAGVAKRLLPFADGSAQVLQDLQNCSRATCGLIRLVQQFAREYEKAKLSRRVLDFSDLEHKTLDLVMGKKRQGITALAGEIGDRFVEIMVDEYQDSNGVQDGIFSALTHKRQNCFMVGDVKQSIYQFRLADPGIFLDKYHAYSPAEDAKPGAGRKIMLSKNFRSAGPVLSAVNDVFETCMSPEVGGLTYGEDEKLYEGVAHIGVPEPEVELCAVDVLESTYEEEAAYTADRIVELINGKHMVRDGDQLRPITADDIVILLRAPGSSGGFYQAALEERGIRVNSGTGVDLLQTEEILFLRSMLQIIDNPFQDIPLIAVLSSRIIGFTADDLAAIRAPGSKKKTIYESLRASDMEKAQNFVSLLKQLRQDKRLCSLSQLVDQLLQATRMDSIFASFPDGAIKTANLQAFYQLVRECESTNQKELGQFLDYLDAMEEKGLSVVGDQKMTGAVTIMSIHKSKGLEFPVVFLGGLSRDFNRESARSQILCNRELGIGMNCVDLHKRIRYPSIAKKAIAAKILADSLSEEMRVLYVAMTRAKDRLIMTYSANNLAADVQNLVYRMDHSDPVLLTSAVSCPGTWVLYTALQKIEAGALFDLASDRPAELKTGGNPWKITVVKASAAQQILTQESQPEQPADCSVDIAPLRKGLSYRYPYLAATAFPSKQTATQLKGRIKDLEAAENTAPPKPILHHWREPSFAKSDAVSSVAYGNAVHAVMQHICFAKCTDMRRVEQQIRRMVQEERISQEYADAVDPAVIYDFCCTPMGQRLQTADNVLREFKFSVLEDAQQYNPQLQGDKVLLQGVVDCAIIEDDAITVLDFKTDRVTEQTLESVADSYRMQVTAYANALTKIFGKKVTSAQLYFFQMNRFVTVI